MVELNQRARLTIKLLEDALISLLEEKSIYNVSIKELCDVAGINRSTFYKHFNSQIELLQFMEDRFIEDIMSYINESKNINIPLKKRLKKVLDYIKDNYKFAKLLINNNVDPNFPKKFFTNSIIEEIFYNNYATSGNDKKFVNYTNVFLMEGCFSVIKMRINQKCDTSTTELSDYIYKLTKIYQYNSSIK